MSDGDVGVGESLAGKLQRPARVVVVQLDARRYLRDVVVQPQRGSRRCVVANDEGVIDTAVLDELPLFLQSGPDSFTDVCFEVLEQQRTESGEGKFVTGHRVTGVGGECT